MSKAVLPGWVKERTTATPLNGDKLPAPFDDADHRAIKALRDGTANEEQQRRALGWFLFATGHRNQPYRTDPCDTAFMCGRRHVAIQIYDMLEAPVRNAADDEQGAR